GGAPQGRRGVAGDLRQPAAGAEVGGGCARRRRARRLTLHSGLLPSVGGRNDGCGATAIFFLVGSPQYRASGLPSPTAQAGLAPSCTSSQRLRSRPPP